MVGLVIMHPRAELVGKTFFHLTVVAAAPRTKKLKCAFGSGPKWKCRCVCGKYRTVTSSMLLRGKAKSCRCKNFTNAIHGNKKYSITESDYRAKAAQIKAGATFKGQTFAITLEHASALVSSACHYCGSLPSIKFRNTLTNGIDRVDSRSGYCDGNVVPCCKFCNFAKNDRSQKDFLDWIEKLVRFNK